MPPSCCSGVENGKKLALKGELGSYFRAREAITTAKEKTES